MRKRIVAIAKGIVYGFALMIALFVTITSYLYRIDITDMSTYADKPLELLAVGLAAFVLVGIAAELIGKIGKKASAIGFWIVFCMVMAFCVWWIYNAQSIPARDARSIYDIASQIVGGGDESFEAVVPKGSYLSLWPFQSGFLLYVEMVLRFIPIHGYYALNGINLGFMGLSLISLYQIVKRWSTDGKTVVFWYALILFCMPYLLYVNFLYNDIPSIACLFFSVWMMTGYLEKKKRRYLLLALIAAGVGVGLRNNSLIFVIAALLLMAVSLFVCAPKERKRILLTATLLILVSVCAARVPQKIYEYRAGNKMGDGVPAVSYIAMGLQDTGGIPGWNNGYHDQLFVQCDYNADLAAQISKESIKASLLNFMEQPAEIPKFFYAKMVPEWCDENFSCLYSTSELWADRSWIAHMIYNGIYTQSVLNGMNYYLSIVYTGFLIYCLGQVIRGLKRLRRKEKTLCDEMELWSLVLLVTIIGGFLFMMIWEGGSRYTMPYMVMMTIYAAKGYGRCWENCKAAIQKLRKKL